LLFVLAQPLNDIMDLSKASSQTAEAVSQLWTAYHSQKDKLSAAIPAEKYERMLDNAKNYPQFVVPIERGADSAKEMHFLVSGDGIHLQESQKLISRTTAMDLVATVSSRSCS
jgi:hypothetical protein